MMTPKLYEYKMGKSHQSQHLRLRGIYSTYARGLLVITWNRIYSPENTNSGNFDMDNVINPTDSPVVIPSEVTLSPNNPLLIETPESRRKLAVTMVRLIIKLTKSNKEKRKQLQ
jgi:hypothetical protein